MHAGEKEIHCKRNGLATYGWDLCLIVAVGLVLMLSFNGPGDSRRDLGQAARDALARHVGAAPVAAPFAEHPQPKPSAPSLLPPS